MSPALLVWPFMAAGGIDDVAAAIGQPGRRVVHVSAMSVRDDAPTERNDVWGQVEDAIRRSGADWTFLRASGFATNPLQWAPAIRAGQPVRAGCPFHHQGLRRGHRPSVGLDNRAENRHG